MDEGASVDDVCLHPFSRRTHKTMMQQGMNEDKRRRYEQVDRLWRTFETFAQEGTAVHAMECHLFRDRIGYLVPLLVGHGSPGSGRSQEGRRGSAPISNSIRNGCVITNTWWQAIRSPLG